LVSRRRRRTSRPKAAELRAPIDSQTIRVLDLVMVMKDEDDSAVVSELRDADDSEIGELRALERDLAIVPAEEDIKQIGATLEPGSAAAVLVWENTPAAPLGSLVRRSGESCWAAARSRPKRLLGKGHERRGDRRDDRGDRWEDRRDDRGDRREDGRDRRPGPGLRGDMSRAGPVIPCLGTVSGISQWAK
jgi:hypothetical protein